MENIQYKNKLEAYQLSGLFTTALRLVVGWTYFSAFWRRLFLANKLDPNTTGYIGEKFNHFLPNALGIQGFIEYLVTHPETLWWTMVIFTIIEGIVGLLFMFGFLTRLMSIGVFGLAMGILLGAGWIGTTCLDEWQIGVLGIAAGFTIFMSGGGTFSLDSFIIRNHASIAQRKWFSLLGSGILPVHMKKLPRIVAIGSGIILFITLFTNQYFHGGVWGDLHNKSVKPKIEIADAQIKENLLTFEMYRTQGVDVYGSFLIGISLRDEQNQTIIHLDGKALSQKESIEINNRYIAKIKPGAHSLIIPLGAKAIISLQLPKDLNYTNNSYTLILTDISGVKWEQVIRP
ncbi:thiosulfate dehydrogenase [quinone] large subunit [Zhouia amylolytica]|uniref:Thiosulfate dehydrogenase [quinone] large subunit n=1 Tax=Zhouia amylolytica TaxID=376730 RepID=A0A1I6QTF4_9FLAO|nr:TQO small subunit DoxD [Zhouia amylolytica]SFS55721.1 thiosulfate dehydrogenase [quinone] large subunit [Zhouia amylolytica]